eukprot:2805448-Amphidinium_carterae.1
MDGDWIISSEISCANIIPNGLEDLLMERLYRSLPQKVTSKPLQSICVGCIPSLQTGHSVDARKSFVSSCPRLLQCECATLCGCASIVPMRRADALLYWHHFLRRALELCSKDENHRARGCWISLVRLLDQPLILLDQFFTLLDQFCILPLPLRLTVGPVHCAGGSVLQIVGAVCILVQGSVH